MSAPTQPDNPADAHPHERRLGGKPRSGKSFVIASLLFLVVFVIFLLVGSPRLLDWTLAQAPPPAPQEVASGTIAGEEWSATAVEGDEDEVPCVVIDIAGESQRHCGEAQARGAGVHVAEIHVAADRSLLFLLASPRLRTFELTAGAETTELEPAYVDFGFPVGYLATEVDNETVTVVAKNADGETRSTVTCDGSVCEVEEAD